MDGYDSIMSKFGMHYEQDSCNSDNFMLVNISCDGDRLHWCSVYP